MRRHIPVQKFARAFAAATFLSLLALLPCSARAQYDFGSEVSCKVTHWPEFSPAGEDFSIRLPTRPQHTFRKVPPGKSKIPLVESSYLSVGTNNGSEHGEQNVRYFVILTKPAAPPRGPAVAFATREEVHKLMQLLAEKFDENLPVGLSLAEPRDALAGPLLGREYAVRLDDLQTVGRVRFFATQRAVYLVGYVRFSYCGIDFLDSFKLKDASLIVR